MRIQTIEIPVDEKGTVEKVNMPFYNDDKYSSWVLVTGATGFNPFSGTEADTLRNYKIGQNLFDQNQGRVLAIKGSIHAPNFARMNLTAISAASFDIADAMNALIEQGRLTITQDSQIVHKDLLGNLFPRLPWNNGAYTTPGGTIAANSVLSAFSTQVSDGGFVKTAAKMGMYFSPPLFVANGRNIAFQVTFPSNYTVPPILNNYILKFELSVEELPQSNLTAPRG